MTDPARRSETVEWSDPAATAGLGAGLAGLDYLRQMADGTLPPPPIAEVLGMQVVSVEDGRVEFSLLPSEKHYNPIGSVHGSVYALLLDSACGCAVHSKLPAGTGYTSLDLTIKFLRALRADTGPVRCIGTVRHFGRRTALAEAEMVDDRGRLYATASSTCVLLAP